MKKRHKKEKQAAKKAQQEQAALQEEQEKKKEAEARLKKFSVDYSRFDSIDDSGDEDDPEVEPAVRTTITHIYYKITQFRYKTTHFWV